MTEDKDGKATGWTAHYVDKAWVISKAVKKKAAKAAKKKVGKKKPAKK